MESVRRKLVRFGGIFMGLNMLALIAVLGAIVYKISGSGDEPESGAASRASPPSLEGIDGELDLPDGARISSASIDGSLLLVTVDLAGGGQELWFYDMASRRVAGVIKAR